MQSNSLKGHQLTIVVNGTTHTVSQEELSFDDLVKLAFNPVPTGPNVGFTITYRRGHGEKPEGSLQPGESVKIKDEMIFNVTPTDRS